MLSCCAYFFAVFMLFQGFGITDANGATWTAKLPASPGGLADNSTGNASASPTAPTGGQGWAGAAAECFLTTVAPAASVGALFGGIPIIVGGAIGIVAAVADAFFVDVPWVDCQAQTVGPVGGFLSGIGTVAKMFLYLVKLLFSFFGFLWQFTTFGYPAVPKIVTVLFAWPPALALVFIWGRMIANTIGAAAT